MENQLPIVPHRSNPTTLQDTLKFSITVSGWDFQSPSNHLRYAIELKDKGGGNTLVVDHVRAIATISMTAVAR